MTATTYRRYQESKDIIERHSRSAFGRESRPFLKNIGSPIKAFGDDEKIPALVILRNEATKNLSSIAVKGGDSSLPLVVQNDKIKESREG